MEWLEMDPIPENCTNCQKEDCCNCDTAGMRWVLSKEDKLRTRRILAIRAVGRLQRQVDVIDQELKALL